MSGGQEIPFGKYLIEHHAGCYCLFCSNGLIKELLLEMAWLRARAFFVCSDFKNSCLAFEHLHKYWASHTDLKKVEGEIGYFVDRLSYTNCMMFWHYSQSLMRIGKTKEACEMLTTAAKWYRNCDYVDCALEQDISMQLEDSYTLLGKDVMMIKPIRLRMDDEAVTQGAPVVSPKPKYTETPQIRISNDTKASIIPIIKFGENPKPVLNVKNDNLIKSSPTKIVTSTKDENIKPVLNVKNENLFKSSQTKIATSTKATTKVGQQRAKAAKSVSNIPTAKQPEASKLKKTKAIENNSDNDSCEKELKPPVTRSSQRLRKQ